MTTTNLAEVSYKTDRGDVELNAQAVRSLLNDKATDAELELFLKICQYQKLNPFIREVYLVKYDASKPASIVVGKDTFTKRASEHPQDNGFSAGIIVVRGKEVLELEGSCPWPGDSIIGGWASVSRKDKALPYRCKVSMVEYNANQSSWKKMPATMIRKVALVQSLREAYPDIFAGLYDEAELSQAHHPIPQHVESKGELPEALNLPPATNGVVAEAKQKNPMCPVHDTEWFKSRSMRGYAHPLGNEKHAKHWCNMSQTLKKEGLVIKWNELGEDGRPIVEKAEDATSAPQSNAEQGSTDNPDELIIWADIYNLCSTTPNAAEKAAAYVADRFKFDAKPPFYSGNPDKPNGFLAGWIQPLYEHLVDG